MMGPWKGFMDSYGMNAYAPGSQGEWENFDNPAYDFDSLSAAGINQNMQGEDLGLMDRLGMKLGLNMGGGGGSASKLGMSQSQGQIPQMSPLMNIMSMYQQQKLGQQPKEINIGGPFKGFFGGR